MLWRIVGAAFVCAALLVACGGGGGGAGGGSQSSPPTPFTDPDGLGLSGQAAGTVVTAVNISFSSLGSFLPVITLDDQERGLVVWFDGIGLGRPMKWQRSGTNQQWSALSELSPVFQSNALSGNAAGDAVLGLANYPNPQSVLRYAPATGWAAAPLDLPMPQPSGMGNLALMADDSIVLGKAAPATSPIGLKADSFRVLRHRAVPGWETLLETPPLFLSSGRLSYLATNPDGTAMLFWVHSEPPLPASDSIRTLNLQFLDVLTGGSFGALPFFPGEYRPCTLTAANSPTRFKVLAVRHREPGRDFCGNLDLIRIDDSSGGTAIRRDRMNPPDADLAAMPLVAMNQQGDAIAIWLEQPFGPNLPRRVLWSQSLLGGPWSTPQSVLAGSADVGELAHASGGDNFTDIVSFTRNMAFAANNNGQVVGVLQTLKNGRQYLIIGRFSFASGWSWQLAANMVGLTSGSVSAGVGINSVGTGLLSYFATPCERASGSMGFSLPTCRPTETYALKF